MNNEEIHVRMMLLARDRLQSMPGAYSLFQNDISGSGSAIRGQAVLAMASALPYGIRQAAGMGNIGAVAQTDEHLLGIIDQWAEQCPISAPSAAPLHIATRHAPAAESQPDKVSGGIARAGIVARLPEPALPATRVDKKATKPAFVPTKEICEGFPPPKRVKPENWESGKYLSNDPAWLRGARQPGVKQRTTALWNPAEVAFCMVTARGLLKSTAGKCIDKSFSAWRDEWDSKSELALSNYP